MAGYPWPALCHPWPAVLHGVLQPGGGGDGPAGSPQQRGKLPALLPDVHTVQGDHQEDCGHEEESPHHQCHGHYKAQGDHW